MESIAREAGERILSYYHRDKGVTYKRDQSPLTLADRAAHELIVSRLRESYPDIPVISEEGAMPDYARRSAFPRFWLVDPLDGTKEFIKKNGEFTVNIALIENGGVALGVVGVPAKGKLYSARRGGGATLTTDGAEPVRLQTKQGFDPGHLVASVSRSHPSAALDAFLQKLPGHQLMGVGSALKFCYLAEGLVDFYPRFGPLNEWDTAPAHLVAEESGAVVRGLDGQPLRYNQEIMKHRHGFLAASSPALLDYLSTRMAD